MRRKLVWIEQPRFRVLVAPSVAGGSKPTGVPSGTSIDEMMHNFELQRDKEFTAHVCAHHTEGLSSASPRMYCAGRLWGLRLDTGNPEVIPGDPTHPITSGSPTKRSDHALSRTQRVAKKSALKTADADAEPGSSVSGNSGAARRLCSSGSRTK